MTDTHDQPKTDVPALSAWAAAHPYGRSTDQPKTSLWFPQETPYVLLDTVNRGTFHDPHEHLADPERPTCHVRLGTSIDIGGYLSDMELYFAAVVESIRAARQYADTIAREMAEEAKEGDA